MTRLLTLPQQSTRLPIPAIGYVRVSKSREEMISPELQKLSITEWAKRSNRQIIDWVSDLDASGRTWNRNIMGVISRVEAKEAREVAVWKYSRFGRDRLGNAINLGRLNRAGGELQSATEDVDASTAVGRLSRDMLLSIAAFESDRLSEGWHETWNWRLEKGLPARGGPRWGYTQVGRIPNPIGPGSWRDPKTEEAYLPEEHLVEHGEWAFHSYLSGAGYRKIGIEWNRRGLRTLAGKLWREATVRYWMTSGFAAGVLRIHDPSCEREHNGKHVGSCPSRLYVPGAQDAMISDQTWEDFKERVTKRAGMSRGERGAKHALSGILRCGHCEARHRGSTSEGQVIYKCSTMLDYGKCGTRTARESVILPHVLDDLDQWADQVEAVAASQEIAAPAEPVVDERAELDATVAKVDRRTRRLVDLYMDEEIERAEYTEKRAELDQEKADALARIEELAKEKKVDPVERVPVARGLVEEWKTLAVDRRRELLHTLVKEVTVWRDSAKAARIRVTLFDGTTREHDISHDYTQNVAALNDARN